MFKSAKEFASALIDGQRYEYFKPDMCGSISHVFHFDEQEGFVATTKISNITDEEDIIEPMEANHWKLFDSVTVYVEPKWYHNIPEKGVLCKVYNTDTPGDRSIEVVVKYDPRIKLPFITTLDDMWKHAEPLTEEQVMDYILTEFII